MKKILEIVRIVLRFVLKYNEWFFSFPFGMILLYYVTKRYIKNGLDAYDIGVTQKLFLGFAFFFFILGMTRIIHRLQWPILNKLIDEDSNSQWQNVPFLHVVWLSVVLFSAVMLSLSILIASI